MMVATASSEKMTMNTMATAYNMIKTRLCRNNCFLFLIYCPTCVTDMWSYKRLKCVDEPQII